METVRTCLSCRQKAEKKDLCRFVRKDDGEICFDEKGDLPRRGAWLCAKSSCLSKAFTKRLLFRDERTLPLDKDVMLTTVTNLLKKAALSRLSLLRKIGTLEAGTDSVMRMVLVNKAFAIIFAKDFSLRSLDNIKRRAGFAGSILVESSLLMEEIGQCLGRRKTGVVAFSESRITDELLSRISKLKELGH